MDKAQRAQYRTALKTRNPALLTLDDENRDAAGTVVLDQSRVGRLSSMDALQV